MYDIPGYAVCALEKLNNAGFEAYLAGGCVRDFIMGIPPHDFDITTNALPEQVKKIFDGFKQVTAGEKHGTVTVIIDGSPLEITTYRIDGCYTDCRRPDTVEFTSKIEDDLKRRDFTVNAMAMDRGGNIIDPFGGKEDIRKGIIKCAGTASKRFSEDALRILRALRFASRLGFSIDETAEAEINNQRELLRNISYERINAEFVGILCGKNAESVLRNYRDTIAVFIPEIVPCFDFEQHSAYHKYDVWEHTVHAVGNCADRPKIKIAMFFHDIAKPLCYKSDSNGIGHFKGHALKGAELTDTIMKRLKFPARLTKDVTALIRHHSDELNSKYELRRLIREIGPDNMLDLLDVQRADSLSKNDFCRERLKKSDAQEKIVRDILDSHECVDINGLAINGNDLMNIGFHGKELGVILEKLLDAVISDELENEYEALLNYARSQ